MKNLTISMRIMKCKGAYLLMGLFCFLINLVHAQDQKVADSLAKIYQEGKIEGVERLELLRNLSFNELNDSELRLRYAEELIALATLENDHLYLHRGYLNKGYHHYDNGDPELALQAFFKSADAADKGQYNAGQGTAYSAIADTYMIIGDFKNAEAYFKKAIDLTKKTNDSIIIGSVLLNAGDSYFRQKKYETALEYFKESGSIFEKVNHLTGKAYNLGNVGMVYAEQGMDDLAEKNINEAIAILEEQEDYYPITVYLTYMSDIYLRKGNLPAALNYTQRSLELASLYGIKEQISEANLKLAELYEQSGDLQASYAHYKDHIAYRDSIMNLENVRRMADLRTDFEVSQKQIEVDLAEQRSRNQRNISIATAIGLIMFLLMAIGLYRRNRFIRRTKRIIEIEKERSDNLLLNILPEETAQELKQEGKVKARKYEAVTVLFSDFKGFTSYSENLSPEALVETVDFYFSRFDAIVKKHGLEKIKTIGDAYMCAGGLRDNNGDHARRMVLAATEIVDFVERTKNDAAAAQMTFDIRIGINTGPVVAGVVGTDKFAYDIWGDTVNVASRMESNSEPGKINISENTYELVKDEFRCTYRGEIEVKNRGGLKMYFVDPHL